MKFPSHAGHQWRYETSALCFYEEMDGVQSSSSWSMHQFQCKQGMAGKQCQSSDPSCSQQQTILKSWLILINKLAGIICGWYDMMMEKMHSCCLEHWALIIDCFWFFTLNVSNWFSIPALVRQASQLAEASFFDSLDLRGKRWLSHWEAYIKGI